MTARRDRTVRRRYDLPAATVAAATERRLAGDWRGACTAARVDVDLDLSAVADAHGAAVAANVEEDLRHLAPDLLRWHLLGELAADSPPPSQPTALATYDSGTGGNAPTLRVVVRPGRYSPPQIVLSVGGGPCADRWDTSRHLWDVRYTDGLRERVGGGARTPFFHRDGRPLSTAELPTAELPTARPTGSTGPISDDPATRTEWVSHPRWPRRDAEVWADAGIRVEPASADLLRGLGWSGPLTGLVAAVRAVFGTYTGPIVLRRLWRPRNRIQGTRTARTQDDQALTLRFDGSVPVARVVAWEHASRFPVAPPVCFRAPAYLSLLRHGAVAHASLHPLVRTALFPDRPDEAYAPEPGVVVPDRFHIQCRNERHWVGWRDGELRLLSHPDADTELRRERALAALGSPLRGCFAVHAAWHARTGRLPSGLRAVTRQFWLAVLHGDAAEVGRLLDAGVDPRGVRGPQDATTLHGAGLLEPALVRRLIAAGADVDAVDGLRCTPSRALWHSRAPAEVRAVLETVRPHGGSP